VILSFFAFNMKELTWGIGGLLGLYALVGIAIDFDDFLNE
jgi:hypothetical protein